MKRVLCVNGGPLDYGGISTFLFNYLSHIDRGRVAFDFVVHGEREGPREAETEALGCRVFHVPVKSADFSGNARALSELFRSGGYRIVHAHLDAMNGYVLGLAKRAGVPVRISHCHNTQYLTTNPAAKLLHDIEKRRIPRVATHLLACSDEAAHFFYGARAVEGGRVTLVKNAVELDRFRFDAAARNALRRELGIAESAFVVGNVARFAYQKNHAFLLDAFAKLLPLRPDAVLVLAGDGELRAEIESQIERLNLADSVRLLGYRADAERLYSLFDAFALPSRFEGLGIVLVEAQLSGLPCFASRAVPSESRVTDCAFLPLDAGEWAAALAGAQLRARDIDRGAFAARGYDIRLEAEKLQRFYEGLPV